MSQVQSKMAFLMDPIEEESFSASTTLVLMREAQRRGHAVLYVEPRDLCVVDGRAASRVTPIALDWDASRVVRGEPRFAFLDDEIDVVFQRKDPPVDADYMATTQILGSCRQTLILNRPSSVLAYNEKLFTLHFRELMPETIVTRSLESLRQFMKEMGGEMIVKPLDGKGGEGIFHLVEGERNISSILEQSTAFETRYVMAQRYLPEVRTGDKRILLLEGDAIGTLMRIPAEAEVRANLHVGGTAGRAELNDDDRRILEVISPVLAREGLFFVGIDVIGGLLTEVNVTSPTGIQEINALEGGRLEEQILERVETRLSERPASR